MPNSKNYLILSCSTGGGHNSAAEAIREELIRRGHSVVFLDPFSLKGPGLPNFVANAYVRLVQTHPKIFGVVYRIGMTVSRHEFTKSPVYYANALMTRRMKTYLSENSFDGIFTTHLFPGEMLTRLRIRKFPLPKVVYISTDYTAIPFVEEMECDAFVIPHEDLKAGCVKRGIPANRILALGIPVRKAFSEVSRNSTNEAKKYARQKLGLSPDRHYFLVVGGSMGAGQLPELAALLAAKLRKDETVILVCGNNAKLYNKLCSLYANHPQFILLKQTRQMPLYMKACDVLFSKPGGLSSTEAAVSGIPLVHLAPIPGCETENREFFRRRGLCLTADTLEGQAAAGRRLMDSAEAQELMRRRQRRTISRTAAEDICDLVL
ncbi:MAG: hypothetical protein LUE29_02180 [Lachnospiraceae bacterium]|nr:hypothetical protein [Lachnospiraceae bacterium]